MASLSRCRRGVAAFFGPETDALSKPASRTNSTDIKAPANFTPACSKVTLPNLIVGRTRNTNAARLRHKAALESAVRYVSAELDPKGIRVRAISPGPLATRAASGIPEFDKLLEKAKAKAPARSLVSIEDVGAATAFLAHDAARLITGDTIYIDGGYHVVD